MLHQILKIAVEIEELEGKLDDEDTKCTDADK